MEDNYEMAQAKYDEARVMAKKIRFKEGVKNAEKSLKRLKKKGKERERELRRKKKGEDTADLEVGMAMEDDE